MAVEITMPKLSDTMEEGTILKWRVQEGDPGGAGRYHCRSGDGQSGDGDGSLRGRCRARTEGCRGGDRCGRHRHRCSRRRRRGRRKTKPAREAARARPMPAEEAAEDCGRGAGRRGGKGRAAVEKARAAAEEEKTEEQGGEERETTAAEPPIPEPADAGRIAAREEPKAVAGLRQEDLLVSPAARQLAAEKGIDLRRVRGTGPGGRIVVGDVERGAAAATAPVPAAAARRETRQKPSEAPPPPPPQRRPERPESSVKIRRLVARKMVESWQSIPHFFVTVAVDMTDIIRIRKDLGASINDFIIAAAARSSAGSPLGQQPLAGRPRGANRRKIDIAVAVATERGLYNPVLHDCGPLSLKEIGRRVADLVEKSHAGKLRSEELEGGTFTISNMGMLGVESFTAIITPPQAAVLAVGTVKGETVVNEKGEPGVATTVRLTLSADHRILDGADAADFLASMKSYLEAPVTLVTCRHGQD